MLLEDATEALGLLDTDRLGFIADKLQALLDSQARLKTTTEVMARQRVFASVLRATGENLSIMERVTSAAGEDTLWAR